MFEVRLALVMLPLINEGEAPRLAIADQPSLSKPVIPIAGIVYHSPLYISKSSRDGASTRSRLVFAQLGPCRYTCRDAMLPVQRGRSDATGNNRRDRR